ncbi:MAG: hypothetical protein R3E87_12275 [Burkholderiaceae bacterium]
MKIIRHLPLTLLAAAMITACGGGSGSAADPNVEPASDAGAGNPATGGDGVTATSGSGGSTAVPLATSISAQVLAAALCADSQPVQGTPLAVGIPVDAVPGVPSTEVFVSSVCAGDPPQLALSSGGQSSPTPSAAVPHFGVAVGLSATVPPLAPVGDPRVNVGGPFGTELVLVASSADTIDADRTIALGDEIWRWNDPFQIDSVLSLATEPETASSPAGQAVFRLCWRARLTQLSRDTCHLHAIDDGRWLGLRTVLEPGSASERVYLGWR